MKRLIALKWAVLIVPSAVYTLIATSGEIFSQSLNLEYVLLGLVLLPVTLSAFKIKTKVLPLGIMALMLIVVVEIFEFMIVLLLILMVSCMIEEFITHKINVLKAKENNNDIKG